MKDDLILTFNDKYMPTFFHNRECQYEDTISMTNLFRGRQEINSNQVEEIKKMLYKIPQENVEIPKQVDLNRTLLKSMRTQQSFEDSIVYRRQMIKKADSFIDVFLIDTSYSMKKLWKNELFNNFFNHDFFIVFLHDVYIYDYIMNAPLNTSLTFSGKTSYENPLKLIQKIAHEVDNHFHIYHFSDGEIHPLEQIKSIKIVNTLQKAGHGYSYYELSLRKTYSPYFNELISHNIKCFHLG